MGRVGQIFRLVFADLANERLLSLCQVIAIAAVLAPVLVLFGLHNGVIGTLIERLNRDPAMRLVVPEAYGFKSVKWLQRVVLTNDYRANDTYHAGNNDLESPMKTFARFVQVPATVPEDDLVVTLLERDSVLVHPGYFFDFAREAFLVVSLLPETRTFDQGVDRLFRRVTLL